MTQPPIQKILERAHSDCDIDELKLWILAIGDIKSARKRADFPKIAESYKLLKKLPNNYAMHKLRSLLKLRPIQVLFRAFLADDNIDVIISYSETMSKNRQAYFEGAQLLKKIVFEQQRDNTMPLTEPSTSSFG